MKSQRLTEMPERELHEDRGAERQKLVIKRHVLLMKPRRYADTDAEVSVLHLRTRDLIEVEILTASAAGRGKLVVTGHLADAFSEFIRDFGVVVRGRAERREFHFNRGAERGGGGFSRAADFLGSMLASPLD